MAGPWPVRPQTEEAWRHGWTAEVSCTAWLGAERLDLPLDVLTGKVTETDAPGIRAVLDVEFVSAPGLWEALAPLGAKLVPQITSSYGIESETTRMGTFLVEEQSLVYDGAGVLRLRCLDLWSRVLGARLERATTPRGNNVDVAVSHVQAAIGSDLTGLSVAASAARSTGKVIFERDRDDLVQKLLTAAGRIGYVDRAGRLVVERPPTLASPAGWPIDPFHGGVLLGATRSRSKARVYNRVVLDPAGAHRWPRQRVDDTSPSSPTRVDGPLGVRTTFVRNPVIRFAQQARVVGKIRLTRTTAPAAQVDISSVPHYGLQPGTVVPVVFPAQGGDGAAAERHLVATVEHPFPPRGGGQGPPQRITMRTARPDGGVELDDEEVEE